MPEAVTEIFFYLGKVLIILYPVVFMITLNKHIPPPFEVVERKGLGHPDTLADGISEAISRSLCEFYLDEFGQILHHNVDKVLIIAGKSAPRFAGGTIIKPPSVVVGGRASKPAGKSISEIIENATASHFHKTVKNLQQFEVETARGRGSPGATKPHWQGSK